MGTYSDKSCQLGVHLILSDIPSNLDMAKIEADAAKRGRAYQCKCCTKYIGEKRYVESHIYKYHLPLHSVPYYCSLCHFITTDEIKLKQHQKKYDGHEEALDRLRGKGLTPEPEKTYMHHNKNPVKIGSDHLLQLSRSVSRKIWVERSVKQQLGNEKSEDTENPATMNMQLPEPLRECSPNVSWPSLPEIPLPMPVNIQTDNVVTMLSNMGAVSNILSDVTNIINPIEASFDNLISSLPLLDAETIRVVVDSTSRHTTNEGNEENIWEEIMGSESYGPCEFDQLGEIQEMVTKYKSDSKAVREGAQTVQEEQKGKGEQIRMVKEICREVSLDVVEPGVQGEEKRRDTQGTEKGQPEGILKVLQKMTDTLQALHQDMNKHLQMTNYTLHSINFEMKHQTEILRQVRDQRAANTTRSKDEENRDNRKRRARSRSRSRGKRHSPDRKEQKKH